MNAERPRVLVVDDDPQIIKLFTEVLKKSCDVTAMADGVVARGALGRESYDCILADQMMPGLTGVELLRQARELMPEAARVLVTASDRIKDLTDAINVAQVHRFLSKPVRVAELLSVVNDSVRQQQLERDRARLTTEVADKNAQLTVALAQVQDNERRLEREVQQRTKELRDAVSELEKLALRDGLTGLFNHRYFQEVLNTELARAIRYQNPVSLLFLDVDHFKNYNDRNGHPAGDELLRQLGQLLTPVGQTVHGTTDDADGNNNASDHAASLVPPQLRGRMSDIVSRYGGEEFVIVLPMTDREGALVRAERLRAMIAAHPFPHRGSQPNGCVSVSVGVASFPADAADKQGLILKADNALLLAKRGGRNRVVDAQNVT